MQKEEDVWPPPPMTDPPRSSEQERSSRLSLGLYSLWGAVAGSSLLAANLFAHRTLRLNGHLTQAVHNTGTVLLFISLAVLLASLVYGFLSWRTGQGKAGLIVLILSGAVLACARLVFHVTF